MPYLLLGMIVLSGSLLMMRWFAHAPAGAVIQAGKWAGGTLLSLAGLYLAISGRIGWLLIAVPALYPLIARAYRTARLQQQSDGLSAGKPRGQTSEVRTAWLRLALDHDNGEMSGDVLNGRFAGRALGSLALDQLLAVLDDCQGDTQSVQLLTAYLERYHADWRARAENRGGSAGRTAPGRSDMTREEALNILGLSADAGEAEIKAAHHRLMVRLHPDLGGSTYLAAKINRAKDLLLGA